MINKISQIVSFSRFKHFSSNDVKFELKQNNLIFAPNGRGKTTISNIIQSLIADDPTLLINRFSKVYSGGPELTVNHGAARTTSRFVSGVWSNAPSDVACLVFDKNFIHQNIHTATVEHDHKKKLHGLIVGEGAIEARDEVKAKRDVLAGLLKEKGEIERAFNLSGVKGMSLDDFSKMKVEDTTVLEAEKAGLNKQLEAVGSPETIKAKPVLEILTAEIGLSDDLEEICTLTVTGGSKEAVEVLEQHSNLHIHGDEEQKRQFLALSTRALGKKDTDTCSLCGQLLGDDAKKLVESLFTIFSNQYLTARGRVTTEISNLRSINEESVFRDIGQTIELNQVKHEDWTKYVNELPAITTIEDVEQIKENISLTRDKLIDALQAKHEDLTIVVDDEYVSYINAVADYNDKIANYNKPISQVNEKLEEYKSGLDPSKKQDIVNQITEVDNRITRSLKGSQELAANYTINKSAAEDADTVYKKALTDFALAQKAVIDRHGEVINQVLEYANAKFRITGIEQGKRPGSTDPYIEYSINLVGGERESASSASDVLENNLSDGEKNLLAFAFYWSLLVHSNLEHTIAIFDDPLSSIDQAWRVQLIEKLDEISKKGLLQLFVLTHYEDFARQIALRFGDLKQLSIELGGAGAGNQIIPYDVEVASREVQFARIDKLNEFVTDPTSANSQHIQAEIRNCLESALKSKYYLKLSQLIGRGWLRDFIENSDVKPLLEANNTYDELNNLCIAGGWANHDNTSDLIFDADQAQGYARRTLSVVEKL